MTKKYLSVEEAAQMLGLQPSEVLRYREQDKIRGFADRGTWKFKTEDVENFRRTLRPDSGSDFPMLDDSDNVLAEDDDLLADQPTVIRRGRPTDDASSDSDVRLIFDSTPGGDLLHDSDSDVRLAGNSGSLLDSSDSDVKLVGGDDTISRDASQSDVRLTPAGLSSEIVAGRAPGASSDSDVKLVGKGKSSGEFSFPALDNKPNPDETIDLLPDNDSVLEEDSGISLVGDSGISLERPDDSGISLTSDSSLSLASDSGISLDVTSDSGISLDLVGSDIKGRGKSVPKKPVKPSKPISKARTDSDLELAGTMPEMDVPMAGGSDDLIDTNMEVPLLDDDSVDSSYDLADGPGDATSVITLDDDSADDTSSASMDVAESESFDEFSEDDEESIEVAGEIGEDDEIEEDVFGADDDDFDDGMTSGESHGELDISRRGAPVAVEQEWGAGTFAGLALTSVVMLVSGLVVYDLVLSMWQVDVNGMNPATAMLTGMLGF